MFTIDRINAIRKEFGRFNILPADLAGRAHTILNTLDQRAGINTQNHIVNGRLVAGTPVGARVRRLEEHIRRAKAPPYFWLGAEAECVTWRFAA